ncbi:MAG: SDR family oxidoreductase [Myxococcales bacterium]|jgi:dTDP-glucose 4,6-dehydratase|nr:SDR family oxidoreductase [Myxococcales bacterium]
MVMTTRKQRWVVTGGAGFLGSHLCETLLGQGQAVVAVDNLITGRRQNVESFLANPDVDFAFVEQDITEPFDVVGEVDFVLNFASPASPIDYAQLPIETLRVGSLGTEHALQLAMRHEARFIQASTSEIYGDPLVHPQREDYLGNVSTLGPRAVYDEAKRYGEAIVSAYRRSRGVNAGIVRIFNTYGPRMRTDDGRVVPAFLGQALRGEPFTVFGDGSQTRSFCYVDDLVRGILLLARSDHFGPVNLGNPVERTMLDFIEAIRALTGSAQPIHFSPLPKDDPKQRRPDIGRARDLLDWVPEISLDEGLRKTMAWMRGELGMG